ncbi:biopolymer transport protein ExbB [Oleiagrimonas soli]|uniref:Biopolymer transport protein ExbB n=2 Tax=Oleiagrimonas soli TaxID=1543381 RepID=A0A841KCT3_9GAMM|nr:MotA/TolQ/ExbB proton channel family protein [Oleiagrimonas soli]MBB6183413.1 biopolymer transport protein ExbB [Oleiagrimonas soli]
MLDIVMAGGWGMLPILVCSAIALAIILERFWSLRRSTVMPPGLGDEVRKWAQSRSLDATHLRSLAENSPLGELLAAALAVRNRSRDEIKERLEDTGRHVAHRMERFLNTLGTIALIGPLLGLLGTVIGLIRMFLAVMVSGVGDPMKMAGGIGEALICTASGLIVAIPAYILHRYFRGRVTGYCMDMEREATALLDTLSTPPRPAAGAPRAAAAAPTATPRPARATR